MNCKDCHTQLYPTDPTVGYSAQGRYYAPLCATCGSSDSGKPRQEEMDNLPGRVTFLESLESPQISVPGMDTRIRQLEANVTSLKKVVTVLRGLGVGRGREGVVGGERENLKFSPPEPTIRNVYNE